MAVGQLCALREGSRQRWDEEEAALCGHILLTKAGFTSPQAAAIGYMYLTVCLGGLHNMNKNVTWHSVVCFISVFVHQEDSLNHFFSHTLVDGNYG